MRVGLPDEEALAAALADDAAPPTGYLVESTVTDVVAEVLVAVRRDPPIGWLVTLGFGGVMTELWSDVTHLLAPVTGRRGAPRPRPPAQLPAAHGFRGRPAADIDALAALVVTLDRAVVGTAVVEVELNPVLVGRHGAIAVDALWSRRTTA